MKILKLFSKKVGRKRYYKYTLNLPIGIAKSSSLLRKHLRAKTAKGRIIIEEE